jgi:hypothetical protein
MRRGKAQAALNWTVLWHCWLLLLGSGVRSQIVNQTTIFKALLRQEVRLTTLRQSVVDTRRELRSAAADAVIALRPSASHSFWHIVLAKVETATQTASVSIQCQQKQVPNRRSSQARSLPAQADT